MIRRPVRDSGRSRLYAGTCSGSGASDCEAGGAGAALSALGISIGIAAIVGVLGISQSSKTGLLNELGQLGNLISVCSPRARPSVRRPSFPPPPKA